MSSKKTLYILRHAKAENGKATQEDADRALAPIGLEAASRLGAHMVKHNIRPDITICSSAQRTRQTLARVQEAFAKPLPEQYLDRLYNASAGEILAILSQLTDDFSSAMVVAHNPGVHQLALKLGAQGDGPILDDVAMQFPPASFVTVTFENTPWNGLATSRGTLESFVTPATLGGKDD